MKMICPNCSSNNTRTECSHERHYTYKCLACRYIWNVDYNDCDPEGDKK